MIVLKGITKRYKEKFIFDNLNGKFEEPGKIYTILGESGCGKSTLLNILLGIDQDFQGNYWLFGKNTKEFSNRDWDKVRSRMMQIVYQDYKLLEKFSVYDNLFYALNEQNEQAEDTITNALSIVGLLDVKYNTVSTLSGGQKQRLALIRATINSPKLLLLDEPTGSLDDENTKRLMRYIRGLKEQGLTIILVTHDNRIIEYADSIYTIQNNALRTIQVSSNKERIHEPLSIEQSAFYTKKVFSLSVNLLRTNIRQVIANYLPIMMILIIFLLAFTAFQSETLGSFNTIFNGIGKNSILINTNHLTNEKIKNNEKMGITSSFDGVHIGFSANEIEDIKKIDGVRYVTPHNGSMYSFSDKEGCVLNEFILKENFPENIRITPGYAHSESHISVLFKSLQVPERYISHYNPEHLSIMFGNLPKDDSNELLIPDIYAYYLAQSKNIEPVIGQSVSLSILDDLNNARMKKYEIVGIYSTSYTVEIPAEIVFYVGYFPSTDISELGSQDAYEEYLTTLTSQNQQTKDYENGMFDTFESYSKAVGTGYMDLLVVSEPEKLRDVSDELSSLFPALVLTSQYELKKGELSGTYKLILLTLIVGSLIITIVLGIIVIMITKSYISKNKKILAILYSLGYSKKEVIKITLYEMGMIFSSITCLAYLFSAIIYYSYLKNTPNYKLFVPLTSYKNLALFTLLVLIIFFISVSWSLHNINKTKLIQYLR